MGHFGLVRRPSGVLDETLEAEQLAQALGQQGTVGWLDLEAATPEELCALERLFAFHPLNFEVMPWLKQPWGIAAATVLMLGLPAGALVFLESHDWP